MDRVYRSCAAVATARPFPFTAIVSFYVGRFAPSPTGPLHFGSVVAALASWLDARAAGGRWLVRIEDLDAGRVQRGASDRILSQLERLGLTWDGEVVFQSARTGLYEAAIRRLSAKDAIYPCACSRRELTDSSLGRSPDGSAIYPGTCRRGLPPGRDGRAIRVKTDGANCSFIDRVQGVVSQRVDVESGDFILKRSDGLFAYQLAVVVDDADQGVTDVVRGADLLDSTARQIHLQRLLELPEIRYLHMPVAVNGRGEKLSKQHQAASVENDSAEVVLARALRFLGQDVPERASLDALLARAVEGWNPEAIPRVRTLAIS
jgi:glutamyl-Q tRNA(Asp) synthetase